MDMANLLNDLKEVITEMKRCSQNLDNLKDEAKELMRGDTTKFFAILDLIKKNLKNISFLLENNWRNKKLIVATISPPKGKITNYFDELMVTIDNFKQKLIINQVSTEVQIANVIRGEEKLAIELLSEGIPNQVSYLLEKIAQLRDIAEKI